MLANPLFGSEHNPTHADVVPHKESFSFAGDAQFGVWKVQLKHAGFVCGFLCSSDTSKYGILLFFTYICNCEDTNKQVNHKETVAGEGENSRLMPVCLVFLRVCCLLDDYLKQNRDEDKTGDSGELVAEVHGSSSVGIWQIYSANQFQ